MALLTHAAKKDVLLCVFKDILELPNESPLHKSCAHDGGNDLDTILLFSPLEIEDMQYLVGAVKTHLSKGDRGIIHSLVALAHKRDIEGISFFLTGAILHGRNIMSSESARVSISKSWTPKSKCCTSWFTSRFLLCQGERPTQ
jgi:hypothetical protein